MAKINYENPVKDVKGRINRKEETYYCFRNGVKIASHYPLKKNPKKITAHQRELASNFADVIAQTKAELEDPERRAYWQEQFDEQKKTAVEPYKILRNFVIASLTKQQQE